MQTILRPEDIVAFEASVLDSIPLARAMQLRVARYDGDVLQLNAPLQPNINDKGCAFGGSLISLMTLAGWGLITLKTNALGLACDIYVQDSSIRYLAPVWEDIAAQARLAEGESWDEFAVTFQSRGRARLRTLCRVGLPDGKDACTFEARFVAIAHKA